MRDEVRSENQLDDTEADELTNHKHYYIVSMLLAKITYFGSKHLRQVVSICSQLGIGFPWFALMLAFDVAFGRLVFRASWKRLAADFDFRKGGLLSIGMAALVVAPVLVAMLRGLF